VFVPLLVATLVGVAVMAALDAPLKTPTSPNGMMSFQLAGTVARSQAVLDAWDAHTRLVAAFGLGFDYLFMLLYSTTLAFACVMAADAFAAHGSPLARIGIPLAWSMWLAAALDAVENAALLKILLAGTAIAPWPAIAFASSAPKFALIVLGLAYSVTGGVARRRS